MSCADFKKSRFSDFANDDMARERMNWLCNNSENFPILKLSQTLLSFFKIGIEIPSDSAILPIKGSFLQKKEESDSVKDNLVEEEAESMDS